MVCMLSVTQSTWGKAQSRLKSFFVEHAGRLKSFNLQDNTVNLTSVRYVLLVLKPALMLNDVDRSPPVFDYIGAV